MPTELIKEFIGKVCTIMLFGENWGCIAKIVAVENNWIKVIEENKNIRLLNGDMVGHIRIMPDKYQEKFKDIV